MNLIQTGKTLYQLEGYDFRPVSGHEGGRNRVWVCTEKGGKKQILRVSELDDRTEEDYLAETEFVHYLARNGAPVADVIPSVNGRLVECVEEDGKKAYISLFEYAKGMSLCTKMRRGHEDMSS